MAVVHVRVGSDARSHISLPIMGYWISDGEIYACWYSSDTVFKNWHEYFVQHRRRGIKDFVFVRSDFSDTVRLCEADWKMDSGGNLLHYNLRHVHYMFALHGIIVRALSVVQRHVRRRIIRRALSVRLFSKLAAANRALLLILPSDIVDAIAGMNPRTFAARAIVVETDAYRCKNAI